MKQESVLERFRGKPRSKETKQKISFAHKKNIESLKEKQIKATHHKQEPIKRIDINTRWG